MQQGKNMSLLILFGRVVTVKRGPLSLLRALEGLEKQSKPGSYVWIFHYW